MYCLYFPHFYDIHEDIGKKSFPCCTHALLIIGPLLLEPIHLKNIETDGECIQYQPFLLYWIALPHHHHKNCKTLISHKCSKICYLRKNIFVATNQGISITNISPCNIYDWLFNGRINQQLIKDDLN